MPVTKNGILRGKLFVTSNIGGKANTPSSVGNKVIEGEEIEPPPGEENEKKQS